MDMMNVHQLYSEGTRLNIANVTSKAFARQTCLCNSWR